MRHHSQGSMKKLMEYLLEVVVAYNLDRKLRRELIDEGNALMSPFRCPFLSQSNIIQFSSVCERCVAFLKTISRV
jgi:hypothetical protein